MINVGAPTEIEQKVLKNVAERSVRFMNSVTESGTIPGGGAAYLNCKAAVDNVATTDPDVYAGVRAVSRALDEPMRAIAANAGFAESATVARARQKGAGYGLNVLTGEIVEMRAEGIVDSARVAEHALRVAASVTTMLLTTDVVVRRRNPETASEP
jgi:chaperonin GroEL